MMHPVMGALVRLLHVAGAAWATRCILVSDWWGDDLPYDRIAATILVVGLWALVGAVAVTHRWRPTARPWRLVLALGVVWVLWSLSVSASTPLAWALNPSLLLRPTLFVVLLSWPTGRLARIDATWIAAYAAASCATLFCGYVLVGAEVRPGVANPLMVADLPRLASVLQAVGASVVLPAGAILLATSAIRRWRQLPRDGRPLLAPILAVALYAAANDLQVVSADLYSELTRDAEGYVTRVGMVVLAIDYLAPTVAATGLVLAVHRAQRRALRPVRAVDLPAVDPPLAEAVAALTGDPTARVAYRDAADRWVDAAGAPIEIGGPGRVATAIERDGRPIAAVDHDAAVGRRATTAGEMAVAAAGASVELGRTEARARAARSEATTVRRDLVAMQDDARVALERDLHDGAQQRLVALALQTRLAARAHPDVVPDDVLAELRGELERARDDLRAASRGVLAAQIAARGLEASIATLASTSTMGVDVDVRLPSDTPGEVAAVAWFVVAEAVANATKHSGGSELAITGVVRDGRLTVSVTDDGRGGAVDAPGSGLDGLRERVVRLGGELSIVSGAGVGTAVRATLPLGQP